MDKEMLVYRIDSLLEHSLKVEFMAIKKDLISNC